MNFPLPGKMTMVQKMTPDKTMFGLPGSPPKKGRCALALGNNVAGQQSWRNHGGTMGGCATKMGNLTNKCGKNYLSNTARDTTNINQLKLAGGLEKLAYFSILLGIS